MRQQEPTVTSNRHPSPKLLPWFANRAGIPISRANELWSEAQCYAAGFTAADSSSFHALALRQFHVRVDSEAVQLYTPWMLLAELWHWPQRPGHAVVTLSARLFRQVFRPLNVR